MFNSWRKIPERFGDGAIGCSTKIVQKFVIFLKSSSLPVNGIIRWLALSTYQINITDQLK